MSSVYSIKLNCPCCSSTFGRECVCVVCVKHIYFPPLAGVVERDLAAVEAYKSTGGDIARQLTSDEVRLLNRPSAFDAGFTLVHLAIRFQRQDMLSVLLTEVSQHICSSSLANVTPRIYF